MLEAEAGGQNFEMDILGIRDSLPPLPVDVTPRVSPFELENFFAGLLSLTPASTEEEWKELEEALNKDRLSNRQLFKE
jgi:hypothetical protein